jgi:hypothetical protein
VCVLHSCLVAGSRHHTMRRSSPMKARPASPQKPLRAGIAGAIDKACAKQGDGFGESSRGGFKGSRSGGGADMTSKPLGYVCFLCGQQYGSSSLAIHVPQVLARALCFCIVLLYRNIAEVVASVPCTSSYVFVYQAACVAWSPQCKAYGRIKQLVLQC